MKTGIGVILAGIWLAGSISIRAGAAEPTAFDLIKEGNKYVGEHAKDKVVEIRSERSIGGLTPSIWYVVYYDHTASMKAAEVKFGGGKFMDLKRPFRVFARGRDRDDPLDREKLKVDSDRAIDIARKEPLLDKVTLRATQLKLRRGPGIPVWEVKLWAERTRKPGEMIDIGELKIDAEDGKVIENDLKVQRVDR